MLKDTLECPICHGKFRHNCAIAIGHMGAGIRTEKKSASSRENMRKAREAKAAKRLEKIKSEMKGGDVMAAGAANCGCHWNNAGEHVQCDFHKRM